LNLTNHAEFVQTPTHTTFKERYRMCPYGQTSVRMCHIHLRITRAIKHNTKKSQKDWGREGGRASQFARPDVVKSLATSLFPSFNRDFHWPRFKGILIDFTLDGSASPTQLICTLLCSTCTRSTSIGSSRGADRPLLPSPLLLRRIFSTHSSPRTW